LLLGAALIGPIAVGQDVTSTASGSPSAPEFNVLGFGDLDYVDTDSGEPDGFFIGQAVAHISASLDESLSVFGEFSATAKSTGYQFEVERLIVKYDFSDQFKLSGGRYHTPIGYWNSAFHHGAWLQTTISRPEMFRFGSEIVPIHFVGVLLEGSLPTSDRIGLEYKAGFGNGRHENIARAGDAGDINSNKAWMVQLNARPQSLFGLNTGIGYYTDHVSPPGGPEVEEQTASVFAAWTRESPEVIVEYLHSTHSLLADSSVSGDVNAWYAQFAYRLSGDRAAWKPYVRLERDRIDQSDPLLGMRDLDYEGGILGLRWDFSRYAAIKGEYRNEKFGDGVRENNFRVQVAFVLSRL
jgi:hypothetical protein